MKSRQRKKHSDTAAKARLGNALARLSPAEYARAAALERRMLNRARALVLSNPQWLTAKQLSECDEGQLADWVRNGDLFSIRHQGNAYYPAYAIERHRAKPRPAVKQVLTILSFKDPWHVAFWFEADNSWLDGRQPFRLIDREPEHLITAALREADRTAIG